MWFNLKNSVIVMLNSRKIRNDHSNQSESGFNGMECPLSGSWLDAEVTLEELAFLVPLRRATSDNANVLIGLCVPPSLSNRSASRWEFNRMNRMRMD